MTVQFLLTLKTVTAKFCASKEQLQQRFVPAKNIYSQDLCLQKQPACCKVRHSIAQLT